VLHFAVVAFLDEVALDTQFDRGEVPLHVTLLGPSSTEADLDQVVTAVELAYASHGPFFARGGDDEVFGADDGVEATLLDDAQDLVDAHLELVLDLREIGVRVDEPQYVGRGYRPHVTVAGDDRIDRGERLELRAIAVLDLAPEGDEDRVAVVDQFPLI
jgi:hypothetical protein